MATPISGQRRSLLASNARIQAPWVKVTIGSYTFGVYSRTNRRAKDPKTGFYTAYNVQYPNYIQSLSITKINGQVNQYTLSISYPVRDTDDPNFFEKVFSSVSDTRKIVFSYGDSSMPTYCYKEEEAIITKVTQGFSLSSSVITYQVSATSSAALCYSGCYNFVFDATKRKPSDIIKMIFADSRYGLQGTFTGMNSSNINQLVDGSDKAIVIDPKYNISVLDYITYLVSCMVPASNTETGRSTDIYILTLHDETTYDRAYSDRLVLESGEVTGPYFKVTRVSYVKEHSDAYELDIGYNTSTIVTNFSIDNNENYSLYYDYQKELQPDSYTKRLNNKGQLEDVFAPTISSKNDRFETSKEDVTW